MDSTILENTGYEAVSLAPPGYMGGYTREIWKFISLAAGTTALALENGRFKDMGFTTDTVSDRFEITVGVSAGDSFCGGIAGVQCPQGQYCFYDTGSCGKGDQGGVCREKAEVCVQVFDPVCGCDGQMYGNECEASSAGVSIADNDTCKSM